MMPIVIAAGNNQFNEAQINAPVTMGANSATLAVYDSDVTGSITSTDSTATGDVLTAYSSRLNPISITGTKGVLMNGVRMTGQLFLDGLTEVSLTGMRFDSTGNHTPIVLDGCSNVYIQGHMSQAQNHGVQVLDCTLCEFDLLVRHPGSQTNDTYNGYSLEGTSSRIKIGGSIRGNASGNKPSYGIDVAATCSDIHVCCPIDNYVDGAVNDPGSVVTYCGASGSGTHVITSSFTGEIELYTGLHLMVWPFDVNIVSIRPTLGVAPTGSDAEFDALVEGVSILGSPLSVAAGTNVGAKETPTTPLVPEGDALTLDITQIGATLPGESLTVIVQWAEA